HPRPETARAWAAHCRTPRPELLAAAGRTLSALRTRPNRTRDREVQRQRCGALFRLSERDRACRGGVAWAFADGGAESPAGRLVRGHARTRKARRDRREVVERR